MVYKIVPYLARAGCYRNLISGNFRFDALNADFDYESLIILCKQDITASTNNK
ncbi:hypothetical protein D3C73_1623430 [compost metagenome]